MPQHQSNEPFSVPNHNQPNTPNFETFNFEEYSDAEWNAQPGNDSMTLSLRASPQCYYDYTGSYVIGPQHGSIRGEPTYFPSEASFVLDNSFASGEEEMDGLINDQETFNFEENGFFNGAEWIAPSDNDNMANDNMALSLLADYPGIRDLGLQHGSICDEPTYFPSEASFVLDNSFASGEEEMDGPINGQDNTINRFPLSDASQQYIITGGHIAPTFNPSINPREDVVYFYRTHPNPVTIGNELVQPDHSIMPAISDPNHVLFVGVSRFAESEPQNSQPFGVSRPVSTYPYELSDPLDLQLDSAVNGQNHWAQSLPLQQLTSPPLFINSQLPGMNEDPQWSCSVGDYLARTSSPENMPTIYHSAFPPVQRNVSSINSNIPAHDLNLNRLHQDDVDMRPTRMEPFPANIPSRGQSNGKPNPQKRRFPPKKSTRTQTRGQKKAAYDVRSNGGACEHCRLIKKGSVSVPCVWCWKLIKDRPHLAQAICYKRNLSGLFEMFSDFFGREERSNSIKDVTELMYGQEYSLIIGRGQREIVGEISIDIDLSSVHRVKIRRTISTLLQHTISTHDSKPTTGGVARMKMSQQESYAIVPDSLPSIGDLDAWGREDIPELARKWPFDLGVVYDLALLEYSKLGPQHSCGKLVHYTLQIVSLSKNLDSRRPIDHNKILEVIKNLPSQFGIEEFNECSQYFQLSRIARIQLYLHAAHGIEEALRSFAVEIDQLFERNQNDITKEEIFWVGVCLNRLHLEYRQSILQYREFDTGTVDDRIKRRSIMSAAFIRIYELWYRRRANGHFPMSSGFNPEDFSQTVRDDAALMDTLSRLNVLEREFYHARQNDPNEDDSMYEKLIIAQVSRKSREDSKKQKAKTWPSHSTKQPSAAASYISRGKVNTW